MEAERNQPTGGERSGGQEQTPSGEHSLQPQASSQPSHSSHGRHLHRQPNRSDLERQLLQLQQHPSSSSTTGIGWQLCEVPGPSVSGIASSAQAQGIPPPTSQEVSEGTPTRRERKPQKPGKYVCTYCGRPCAKPSVLQKHIRSHTGERPYPCEPCGFSFKTKSNLYKHRKSHAHRIKAGISSSREDYSLSGTEGLVPGEDPEEPTEGESTDSEEETGQHGPATSQDKLLSQKTGSSELSSLEEPQRTEDSQAVKQRLAMRLSERKRVPMTSHDDPTSSLGPGSKGSTESGYCSLSGSTELSQVSPPSTSAKTYAEIILGKYGRLGQQQRGPHQQHIHTASSTSSVQEEKTIPFTVPKTQVIEHITKLITINEAVVDTSEIDSVKPRRSLSRRSSIESPKFSALKEPHVFDPKTELPGPSSSSGSMGVGGYIGESFHSKLLATNMGTSTVPLLRSHSMPSSAGQGERTSTRSFRLSHSFDERQAVAAELRVGHHHRILKRQPAIEVPLGAELIPEESCPSSTTSVATDPGQKQRQGSKLECEVCGARYKKGETCESHRCHFFTTYSKESEREMESSVIREDRPQMMNYKFKAMAMAVRKRRKEESLEEDPPSPGPAAVTFPLTAPITLAGQEDTTERKKPLDTLLQMEQDRRSMGKEISVIQHTSSFEKQESMSMECQEKEEKPHVVPAPSEEHQPLMLPHTQQQPSPKPHPFSRLVRQSNIQVPEILVTTEPDVDTGSTLAAASLAKEPEKVEEFQWPQRSQTLAQLPAEKLPPKKKRLRLAEAAQSSGESSFESVSLPRSPTQESSVSHGSSRSTSFEELIRPDAEMTQASTSHMLTVPYHHQHHHPHREMRRSASEQAPTSTQHSAQIVETRSKSFDYGCLSSQCSATTWKERRKYLLVKHATLGEPDPEEQLGGPSPKAGSPKSHSSHSLSSAESSVVQSSRISPDSTRKSVQLHQSSLPFFPTQLQAPETLSLGHLTQLFPANTSINEVSPTEIMPQTFLQSNRSQYHPSRLHPGDTQGLPFQSIQPLLPLQCSTGAAQALYLPIASGLTLQVPTVATVRECKPISSSTQSPIPSQHDFYPHPMIASCQEQLMPVVSLVVPVRLQTHMPTYATAMYTTLSQILVTTQAPEPVSCCGMLLEESKPHSSYLEIPSTKSHHSMALPIELEYKMEAEDGHVSVGVGGNKRMLSPAGSLELSSEAQRQQKRVKEEEEETQEEEKDGDEGSSEIVGYKEKVPTTVMVHEEKNIVELTKEEKAKEKQEEDATKLTPKTIKAEDKELNNPKVPSLDKRKDPPYPSLHTTTLVSWCYLNYIKPNPTPQQDTQSSVYSSWCVSVHNPNLPGLSTKSALSLLRSKQKHSLEIYTIASAPQPAIGKLVPADAKKYSAPEVRPKTPVEVKEALPTEEEKEKKDEETPSTSKRSEPARVRIFEGGYKSNEEYIYVRGRGRGKYVCEECGIRCKKPSMLKKHIRTHTDVRPYVCKHCNFAFKTKGNLTKHMKSKAHGKKCQEMGISGSSLEELEEEGGGSEDRSGGGQDDPEEHQFSDVEESEDDDDNEDEEEEDDESSSHDEPPSSCSPDSRPSSKGRSDSSQPQQRDTPDPEPGCCQQDIPSPRRRWPSSRSASPGSRRALFARRPWEASPRGISPGIEGSPLHCLSPSRGLSPGRDASPLRCLSPRLELSSPSHHLSPSSEQGVSPFPSQSPLRPLSPSYYTGPRALSSSNSSMPYPRPQNSSVQLSGDTKTKQAAESLLDQTSSLRPGPVPFPPVPQQSPYVGRFQGHTAPRTVDHVFSHLPLHSQQLSRTPCLMIPIGGIQMVQPRPSPHSKMLRYPASTSLSSHHIQTPAKDSRAQGSCPRAGEQGRHKEEEEAGPSMASLCTRRLGCTPLKKKVLQTSRDETKEAEKKQYGSSRTYPQSSVPATGTHASTSSPQPGPSHSQPALTTQQTERRRGSELARGGAKRAGAAPGVGPNKNSETGST